MHLEVDLNSPYGIKGLTNDMLSLFNKHHIDQDTIKENPQEMIRIVQGLET